MSTNLTPVLINETQTRQPRDVITATEWNRLFNLIVAQGNDSQEKIQSLVTEYLTNAVLDSGVFDDNTKTISLKDGDETILSVDITHTHSDLSSAISTLTSRMTAAEGSITTTNNTLSALDQNAYTSSELSTSNGYTLNFYDRSGALEDSISLSPVIALINAKYTKPVGGVPLSDLASPVVASLGKADTALQPSIVKNVLTASTEQIPNSYAVTTALANKASKSRKITKTLTFGSGTTTASVADASLTSNSKIIVDLDLSNVSASNVTAVEAEWAKIYRVYTTQGYANFVAKSTPSVSFTVSILEVD